MRKATFKTLLFVSFSLCFLLNPSQADTLFAGQPIDITITNTRNDKFTVSWVTDAQETGQINYGTTTSLGNTANDDRGSSVSSKAHHITLKNLLPQTQYYYEIVSGGQVYNNSGQPYVVTTGPSLNPPSGSHVAYGQVFLTGGQPAEGAIAALKLEDRDSTGSPDFSQPVSGLTNSAGWWNIELNNLRTQDLTQYFSFSAAGDNEILTARIDKYSPTSITFDTAQDHPAPSVTLGWILNMTEMPWHQNQQPYYTGAAAAQMILDYIREGAGAALVSQNDIYNYAHPNPDSRDLTPDELDSVLGHFDPYDSLVSNAYDGYDTDPDGNMYQGYNFSVDTYNSSNPNALNDYMRDICHWMAFTVTQEEWWKKGALVGRPNTPAAVPIFGDTQGYNHWVAVKGAATSNNPAPDPLNNPWNTPDFTIYGFWIKDPLVSGIGENKYATADECRNTYFRPLVTTDAYNGMYVQIAEPPAELSKAQADLARPMQDPDNLQLVSFALQQTAMPDEAKGKTAYARPRKRDLGWKNIIDPLLLTDKEVTKAFEGTNPERPVFVRRLDARNKDYYLIAYRKSKARRNFASGVIIIDAALGYFKEASWAKKPIIYNLMSKDQAIYLVKKTLPRKYKIKNIIARLVWQPGKYSSSPYKPFWQVIIGKDNWFVTQEGKVYKIK